MSPQDDSSQENQLTSQSPQVVTPQAPASEESLSPMQPAAQTQPATTFQPQGVDVSPYTGNSGLSDLSRPVQAATTTNTQPAKAKKGKKKLLLGVLIVLLLVVLGAGGAFGYT